MKHLLFVLIPVVIVLLGFSSVGLVSAQILDPGGESTPPLRIMVPSPATAAYLAETGRSYIDNIPSTSMNIERSFSPGPRPNVSGTFHALAVLVEFSDNLHNNSIATNSFNDLLFNSTANSMRHFYSQNSYGQLDIVTLDLPSSMGWIAMPNDTNHKYSYYVNGARCLGSYPRNCQKLAEDVAVAVDTAFPGLDWSQYDNDNDGDVDAFFIIHAGRGSESTNPVNFNLIWSHSWSTTPQWQATHLFDGKRINAYTTEPEYIFTPGDLTFGVFAHELGHVFGLPDLYDIDNITAGIGKWSLMSLGTWNGFSSAGGDSPAHLDAWSRIFLGFTTATLIPPETTQTINLPNVEQNSSNAIYRINTKKPNEYFLLENRQQLVTSYDFALPGSGLLIWHVDDNLHGGNLYECGSVNNWLCQSRHFQIALEQADGLHQLELKLPTGSQPANPGNRGDAGDPFPGSTVKRAFNFTTNPQSSSYYSSLNQGISISAITDSASTMTAFVDTIVPSLDGAAPVLNFFTVDDPVLTWSSVTGAVRYEIQLDQVSTFTSPDSFFTTSTNYTLASLADGVWYWRVRACTSITSCTGSFTPAQTLFIKTS